MYLAATILLPADSSILTEAGLNSYGFAISNFLYQRNLTTFTGFFTSKGFQKSRTLVVLRLRIQNMELPNYVITLQN